MRLVAHIIPITMYTHIRSLILGVSNSTSRSPPPNQPTNQPHLPTNLHNAARPRVYRLHLSLTARQTNNKHYTPPSGELQQSSLAGTRTDAARCGRPAGIVGGATATSCMASSAMSEVLPRTDVQRQPPHPRALRHPGLHTATERETRSSNDDNHTIHKYEIHHHSLLMN